MTRYRAGEVERWIDDIEQRSLDRCRAVERYLLQDDGLSTFSVMPDAKERLFAAMLTGDPELLRRSHFRPRWVSWIENQRPYAWLSTHDEVLIDLVPPDVDARGHRGTFVEKYHCTVAQFVRLVEAMPDRIRINIRNDNVRDYTSPDVIDDMGEILSLAQRYPDSFYKLRPIRNRAFPRLGVSLAAYEEKAGRLCALYEPFYRSLPAQDDDALLALTRVARFPTPRQLVGRLSYYLAARDLWPGERDGARDEHIEAWLQPCLDDADPIRFGIADLSRLTNLVGRLYATHHLFTAQLTGALGGTYGWRPIELDFATEIYDRTPPPKFEDGRQLAISSWFFALQAGMVNRPGERGSVELLLPPLRHPNDAEWQSFLARVNVNRQRFRERLGRLSELAGIAVEERASLDKDDETAVQQIVDRLEAISRSGFDTSKAAGPIIGTVAAGMKAIGVVDCTTALSIAGTAYSIARAVPFLRARCETFERFTDGICKMRTQRTALAGALSDFDLPYDQVVRLAHPKA